MAKEREAFNFYRSYYEVYSELSNKEKILFMDALLNRQFNGVEPEGLDGMAKFAYVSQKHSIDKQIKGWEDKTGNKLFNPTEGPCQGGTEGGTEGPCQQEKGEEKEKVEYTMHPLVKWLNESCPKVQQLKQPITNEQAETILNEFSRECIRDIFQAMQNHKKLNSNYVDANLTFRGWVNRRRKDDPNYGHKENDTPKFKAAWQ